MTKQELAEDIIRALYNDKLVEGSDMYEKELRRISRMPKDHLEDMHEHATKLIDKMDKLEKSNEDLICQLDDEKCKVQDIVDMADNTKDISREIMKVVFEELKLDNDTVRKHQYFLENKTEEILDSYLIDIQ